METEKSDLPAKDFQPVAPAERLSPSSLQPRNLDELWRLSNALSRSELVPKAFRTRPADIMVAVQLGAELGLKPMQALQSICVINGRPDDVGGRPAGRGAEIRTPRGDPRRGRR